MAIEVFPIVVYLTQGEPVRATARSQRQASLAVSDITKQWNEWCLATCDERAKLPRLIRYECDEFRLVLDPTIVAGIYQDL